MYYLYFGATFKLIDSLHGNCLYLGIIVHLCFTFQCVYYHCIGITFACVIPIFDLTFVLVLPMLDFCFVILVGLYSTFVSVIFLVYQRILLFSVDLG